MKKIINYKFILCCIVIITACTKDFISKDIKNDTVNIIAPADNLKTPNNSITFWWDKLDGAETYNLQIVKPRFDSILQLIVDTTITGNKFNYTFTPGKYQWRIKAINGGSSTAYTTRSLVIDTTSNLHYVTVSLITPVTNYKTSSFTTVFSWNVLPSATSYNLMVTDPNGLITNINTPNVTYTLTFTLPGIYRWKVQGQNSFTFSNFSEIRSFKIDNIAPTPPGFTFPTANGSATLLDSLKWVRNSNDVIFDSLFMSTDSFSSQIVHMEIHALKIAISDVVPSLSGGGVYYFWRLKSIDSTGNRSSFSATKKFKLN